ncbi:hypothetical protein [Antarctobacter sp.]|uniref:hypothetical protein n=1 Tax=Antarctobacter sp. TaxID=1872577 RepID=UPI003A9448C0
MSDLTEIEQAAALLRTAIDILTDDLATYPGPVSGCDAQYTHLLATRTRVRKALTALDADVFIATPRTLRPGAGVESR